MSKLIVRSFAISLDGYGAGPDQSLENPLGKNGEELHPWMIATKTFKTMSGKDGGSTGIDDRYAKLGFQNIGAWILGRNMFGPVRGDWPDDSWKGWWGDNPPYHVPTFVLTHYPRDPIEMEGGTTFYFVTEGIEHALDLARKAAGAREVRLGGGVSTVHQYLRAGLVDTLHIAISPVLLGAGEHFYAGIDLPALGYQIAGQEQGEGAMHLMIEKRG